MFKIFCGILLKIVMCIRYLIMQRVEMIAINFICFFKKKYRCVKSRYIEPPTIYTVCPESSEPPEKIFNIFASENDVYTIY